MPELGGQVLRSGCAVAASTGGIIWLDPPSAPAPLLAAALALALPLVLQPPLRE